MLIDTEQPIQTYKVMVSEVVGSLILVPASSPEDAIRYAKSRNTYPVETRAVIDTHYEIYTDKERGIREDHTQR